MATRSDIKKRARRNGMQRGSKKRGKSLARQNTCSCHPEQWGLKKGLRRARRRVDKEIVASELGDT